MKVIDQNNIDEWLFDYFEGNLNAEEISGLNQFLKENPAFQQDYEAWKSSYLPGNQMLYPDINRLLKPRDFFHGSKLKWIIGSFLIGITAFLVYLYYPYSAVNSPLIQKQHNQINVEIRTDTVLQTSKDTIHAAEKKEISYTQTNPKIPKRRYKKNKLTDIPDSLAVKTDTSQPGKIHFFVPKLPPEVLKEIMYIKEEKLNSKTSHNRHDTDQKKLDADSVKRQEKQDQ